MTDFKVALNPNDPRCMVHPEQRLLVSHDANPRAKSISSCPICNADYFDRMAKQPGVISFTIPLKRDQQKRCECGKLSEQCDHPICTFGIINAARDANS